LNCLRTRPFFAVFIFLFQPCHHVIDVRIASLDYIPGPTGFTRISRINSPLHPFAPPSFLRRKCFPSSPTSSSFSCSPPQPHRRVLPFFSVMVASGTTSTSSLNSNRTFWGGTSLTLPLRLVMLLVRRNQHHCVIQGKG